MSTRLSPPPLATAVVYTLPQRPRAEQVLVEVHAEAAAFYQSELRTPAGKPAATMLLERGVTRQLAKQPVTVCNGACNRM